MTTNHTPQQPGATPAPTIDFLGGAGTVTGSRFLLSFDGYRVLVDRLWPRGVSKERADLDEWAKDIAPSTELRKWFGHDPAKFKEFAK